MNEGGSDSVDAFAQLGVRYGLGRGECEAEMSGLGSSLAVGESIEGHTTSRSSPRLDHPFGPSSSLPLYRRYLDTSTQCGRRISRPALSAQLVPPMKYKP